MSQVMSHPSRARVNCKITKYVPLLDEFNLRAVSTVKKKGNPKKPVVYLKQPAFFDSETSYDHSMKDPVGWVYQWAMEFNNQVVVGRNLVEWLLILKQIYDYYELSDEKRLLIYCHNLSYDFTYFYQFLMGTFGAPEILAVKAHKILSARFGGLEFRCSYLLSNMSLSLWGDKLGSTVRKMVGAIDYDKQHYPDEELSQEDWDYMLNDVLALKENVFREMLFYNDTCATIPYTSTSYVRRDTRKACAKDKQYRYWFRKTRLNADIYMKHIEAGAGGLTHGNRHYGGITVDNVGHIDAKSHYPSMQQLKYFPEGQWLHYYSYDYESKGISTHVLKKLLKTQCCLVTINFNNLRIKEGVTCPCVSKHKVLNYWDVDFRNDLNKVGTDNGKVLYAYGNVMLTVTELDLEWIFKQYDTDGWFVTDLWTAERGRMKQPILDTVNSYFKNKETLPSDSQLRVKSKSKLNAIFGMTYTNPIRQEISLNFDTLEWERADRKSYDELQEELDKYYSSRNNFNPYSYGIYTTSWARYVLLTIIELIGYDNYLYCDTDSVMYKKTPGIDEKIAAYNEKMIEENKKFHLGVKNIKGKMSYYGVFEDEGDMKQFRFLHSKCYAYIDMNDKLNVTIAGVTKDNKQPKDHPDYITSAEELGDIDNLHDGFVFEKCGGTKNQYIEAPVGIAYIEGHRVEYASRCIISTTTKELGGTVEGLEEWEEAPDV